METEGIYRLSGQHSKVTQLLKLLQEGTCCWYTVDLQLCVFCHTINLKDTIVSQHLSLFHSRLKTCLSTNPSHLYFFTHWTAFIIMGLDRTYHAHQFIFSFLKYIFCFILCGRLSWISVSFLLHVKCAVSYHIVKMMLCESVQELSYCRVWPTDFVYIGVA